MKNLSYSLSVITGEEFRSSDPTLPRSSQFGSREYDKNEKTVQAQFAPNPAFDQITFDRGINNLRVHSIDGVLLMSQLFLDAGESFSFDLEPGIYTMVWECEGRVETAKLIKI